MYTNASFQSQLIYDDQRRRNFAFGPRKKKLSYERLRDKAKVYLKLFLKTSSIHGLNHLVARRRHPLEILLWLSMVQLSVFGAVYLSRTTWIRYQSSPTVVSMDRDMFAWNTTFPCITICPNKKVDENKLEKYLNESTEPDKKLLENFIRALANATIKNFDAIPDYDGIAADKFLDLIVDLGIDFRPRLTIGAEGIFLQIITTITELGVCYAVNSNIAIYSSPEYWSAKKWNTLPTQNSTFFIHPLDGEVFAQIINLSTPYDVYIHGPDEVPDVVTKYVHSEIDFYMKLYVTASSIYTTPEASKLKPSQRRCRFPYENEKVLLHSPVYAYTLCRMECRIRLCQEYCGCIPHFYRKISNNEKTCDARGLKCLARFKDELYKLREKSGKRIECECLPLCDDVNYVVQSNVIQPWFLGTNLQWGIITYPRMRFKRDIIFGFTDVLVSVGGMAGLFLGCSVLSFMEIVYFLTFRLCCYARGIK